MVTLPTAQLEWTILIHDLLTFSRASRAPLDLEQVDMEEILVNVLSNMEDTITESSARISHDPLPTLLASTSQMDQVMQNLIGNALKFRGDSPLEIHIGHEQVDGGHRFYVRDTGIGIAPGYVEKIFTIFQRLHSHTEYEGTGIGLSVSRTIVERLGGKIWVESAEGKGSTFYFTIPYQSQGEKS